MSWVLINFSWVNLHLNIKWVFLIQNNIQDCIKKWWCNYYYNLYDQSDETEKEVHNYNVCKRSFKQHI